MAEHYSDELLEQLLDIFAEMAHEIWMERQLHDGWAYSHKTEYSRKLDYRLRPYEILNDDDKQWYRELAMRYTHILRTKIEDAENIPKGEPN